MLITSSQNKKIKNLRLLYKSKALRSEQKVFIAEGNNLVKDIPSFFHVVELYIEESKYNELKYLENKFLLEAYIVEDAVFESVADTKTPSGVIALVEICEKTEEISGDIVLLLDGIMDAGNMGTIIRTAAARGIKTILSINGTDPYSPKAIRASMGGIFYLNIIECNTKEAIDLLNGYKIVVLDMDGENIYHFKKWDKIALTVGSEAHGISKEVKSIADKVITIPMESEIDSLNAAMSIGIAMFLIH